MGLETGFPGSISCFDGNPFFASSVAVSCSDNQMGGASQQPLLDFLFCPGTKLMTRARIKLYRSARSLFDPVRKLAKCKLKSTPTEFLVEKR